MSASELNNTLDNERWLEFWFKPYLYLHSSWMKDVDQRLLTENSSSLAWHVSYPYVCNVYRISLHYRDMTEGLINNVIFDLLAGGQDVVDMASFMLGGISKSDNFSQTQKRILLQRSRALSLRKRLYDPTENIPEQECGLLLIYLLCQCVDPEYWQRARLFFEKSRVLSVERGGKFIPLSDANKKAVQRAWNEIYQLKPQPEVEQPLDTVDASNDEVIEDNFIELATA